MSPGSMSIIGRNVIDDFPGCSPLWTDCIMPDHIGRDDFNGLKIFQSKSTFQVKSRMLIAGNFSYLKKRSAAMSAQ